MCVGFYHDYRELNSVTKKGFNKQEGQLAYLVSINELMDRTLLAVSTLITSSTNLLTLTYTLLKAQ